mmetsp:Transcript_11935/g.24402  ORF Transcript_11935/g.24402 Transcript_11935/m.24402 type:complete len:229 (-) Transcript_11935:24-710(-)
MTTPQPRPRDTFRSQRRKRHRSCNPSSNNTDSGRASNRATAMMTTTMTENVKKRSGMGEVNMKSLEEERIQSEGRAVDSKAEDKNYEYLPHTADIQLHSWGPTLSSALSSLVVSMFGYMTDLNLVTPTDSGPTSGGREIVVKGHDLHTMVFTLLDEWLYRFHNEGFVAGEVEVYDVDEVKGECRTKGKGEVFDMKRHKQGTEVKAITYSNMQVVKAKGKVDVYVIIDI